MLVGVAEREIHSSKWIKHKSCVNTEIAGRLYTLLSGLGIVSFDFTEETVTDLVDFKFICMTKKHSARDVAELEGFKDLRKHLQLNAFFIARGLRTKITPFRFFLEKLFAKREMIRLRISRGAADGEGFKSVPDD